MKKITGDRNSRKLPLDGQINSIISEFHTEIAKEPVPDRLTDIALELQNAINRKLDGNQ